MENYLVCPAPPRVSFFFFLVWTTVKGIILTLDKLRKRGYTYYRLVLYVKIR